MGRWIDGANYGESTVALVVTPSRWGVVENPAMAGQDDLSRGGMTRAREREIFKARNE